MLYEFLHINRDAIIARSRQKLTARPWPTVTSTEIDHGVPLFLTQLTETLKNEGTSSPFSATAIGSAATLHGRDLLALGFTASQVVHDYGDICQAVTEIAMEQNAPITTDEFHTLNRCLDTATAEAVTEHARITAEARYSEEVERSGQVAHETRDLLNTAVLAFEALKRGTVAVNGSTGAMLGRSLTALRDLVDSSLSEIRLNAKNQRTERLSVAEFINDRAVASGLQAESRNVKFSVAPVDPTLFILGDEQILASAVTNLLNNAFKFTPGGKRVVLRAFAKPSRVVIEVEDECGGIPASKGDPFLAFGEQRGADRTGLGLGLSIARKGVRAHGGDIYIRNLPGQGCIFSVELPLAKDLAPAAGAAPSLTAFSV
ncbi:MAG: HAMP domain-containing sensor histidine kinase [Thermoanaerobaculia bacterium]